MEIDLIISNRRDLRPFHHAGFLTKYWEQQGHRVRVVQAYSSVDPAEIGFLHVDLTRLDHELLEWAKRYRLLVNGRPRDISKRAISANLVAQQDGYQGPVIVKTDLNRGGKPELRRGKAWFLRQPLTSLRREVARRLDWRLARALPPNDYPVLERKELVPDWVWRDPSLVVEKFLPERQGGHYVSRIWVFLGNRGYGRREVSESATGRGGRALERSYDPVIPDEVRDFRARHEMDYGKIDWAYSASGPVVFDANRTPSRVTSPAGEDLDVMMELARGIEDLATG
jgi:hypothetical protein